jgi:hypothetical protein
MVQGIVPAALVTMRNTALLTLFLALTAGCASRKPGWSHEQPSWSRYSEPAITPHDTNHWTRVMFLLFHEVGYKEFAETHLDKIDSPVPEGALEAAARDGYAAGVAAAFSEWNAYWTTNASKTIHDANSAAETIADNP